MNRLQTQIESRIKINKANLLDIENKLKRPIYCAFDASEYLKLNQKKEVLKAILDTLREVKYDLNNV